VNDAFTRFNAFFFLTKSGQWKTMETRVHLDPSFIFVILQKKETYAQKDTPNIYEQLISCQTIGIVSISIDK